MEKLYRLELIGITYNQIESGVYALILQQVGTTRRIPIIIGFLEAQAIECKLQEVSTPRPLTHDTMAASLAAFGITLLRVEIRKLPNGVFAADLVYSDGKKEKIIDSRSSDAVALAIRVGAPIYTSEQVLNEAGFDAKGHISDHSSRNNYSESSTVKTDDFSRMSLQQLSEAMLIAAENENYEEAARIKAELERRNNNEEQIE